ncbi:MAG: asparaginase [Pseudomonadota bacterium]
MSEAKRTSARRAFLVVVAMLLFLPAWLFSADDQPLPKILIIATGGTIAGVQDDPNDPSRYRAGSLSAQDIIKSVPELENHAVIETLQFSNVPSTEIQPADWLRLATLITKHLNQNSSLAGVVITHGTDRLEETAFFLHLTVGSDKPVVIVGAQRPATGTGADGPANLLAAIRTAASPDSRDRGVLVVMDDRILSAREVRKDYPRVGGFLAGRIGVLGASGPEYLYSPTRPHTHRSQFQIDPTVFPDSSTPNSTSTRLAEVPLLFSYSGGLGNQFPQTAEGVVIATTNTTCDESLALQVLARNGTAVVAAFPTGESVRKLRPIQATAPARVRETCSRLEGDPRWQGRWIPPIPAQLMTPQKARILLMLALPKVQDREQLAEIFSRY